MGRGYATLANRQDSILQPNVNTYSPAISAWWGGQWAEAMRFFANMQTPSTTMPPWGFAKALQLFADMGTSLQPDVITHTAAIIACKRGDQQTEALQLSACMQRSVSTCHK